MYQRLSKLRELRERRAAGESGFTLIELLVVVVIIGILIAIAIPVYLNYQKGAKDKSADSDVRNAVAVLEQCSSDNGAYPNGGTFPITGGSLSTMTNGCSQTINASSGTLLKYAWLAGGSGAGSYILLGYNTGGSPKVYCYNSLKGGSVQSVATGAYTAGASGVFGTWADPQPTC